MGMKKHGFTLIELLVVIAIIAILAAILFPVFAQAREQARKTTCASNCKQLGTGMMMYLQDYDEQFPSWNWNFFCNGGNNGAGRDSSAFWTMAIYPYVKNAGLYKCPDDRFALYDSWAGCSDDAGAHDMFNSNNNYVSYGFNEYYGNSPKYAAVQEPSRCLMLADSATQLTSVGPIGWWNGNINSVVARAAFANDTSYNIFTENGTWSESWTPSDFRSHFSDAALNSATRHNGGSNITYSDGHTKFSTWSQITWCKVWYDAACPNQ